MCPSVDLLLAWHHLTTPPVTRRHQLTHALVLAKECFVSGSGCLLWELMSGVSKPYLSLSARTAWSSRASATTAGQEEGSCQKASPRAAQTANTWARGGQKARGCADRYLTMPQASWLTSCSSQSTVTYLFFPFYYLWISCVYLSLPRNMVGKSVPEAAT